MAFFPSIQDDPRQPAHWDRYLDDCRARDPRMPEWSAGTLTSLRARALGILAESGYLAAARPRILQAPRLAPEVAACLRAHGEYDILRRMQPGPTGRME